MRVRVTQRVTGSIDGIQLDQFEPGYVYDVGTAIGSYLLAVRAVEPVADDSPALVLPLNQPVFGHPPLRVKSNRTLAIAESSPVPQAADRPRRERKRR
jgi:hypothetical protein